MHQQDAKAPGRVRAGTQAVGQKETGIGLSGVLTRCAKSLPVLWCFVSSKVLYPVSSIFTNHPYSPSFHPHRWSVFASGVGRWGCEGVVVGRMGWNYRSGQGHKARKQTRPAEAGPGSFLQDSFRAGSPIISAQGLGHLPLVVAAQWPFVVSHSQATPLASGLI